MLLRCVLCVPSPEVRDRLLTILRAREVLVETTDNAVTLWQVLQREPADMIVVGERVLSRPIDPALDELRHLPDTPSVVVVIDHDDAETRARLLGAGCAAVLPTEMTDTALGEVVASVVARRRERPHPAPARAGAGALRASVFRSRSTAMQRVLEVARRVVPARSPVLVLGETGVGKEHLARAIHEQSPRQRHPFVPVNCAAIPEALFESELFGHERGAFTGAVRAHRGFFEMAHGGTIFLDEIGDTPLHVQAKLLRVLQDQRIQRVGAESSIPIDVRLMAATNHDLERGIRDGTFRADLFYRIGVVSLTIPPLRERRDDIPELVHTFVDHFREQIPSRVNGLDEACMRALIDYEWPGNIRELINVIERAVLITDEPMLGLADLPDTIRGVSGAVTIAGTSGVAPTVRVDPETLDLPLREARSHVVAAFERAYLAGQLERTEGRIGATARRAGITPRSLFDKMKRLGLSKEDFKP